MSSTDQDSPYHRLEKMLQDYQNKISSLNLERPHVPASQTPPLPTQPTKNKNGESEPLAKPQPLLATGGLGLKGYIERVNSALNALKPQQ